MMGVRNLKIAFSIASLLALLSCATVMPVASAGIDASFGSSSDSAASRLTILTPTSYAHLNSSMVTISWMYNGDDLDYFDLRIDSVEFCVGKLYSSSIELNDGIHVVEVQAHTTANNSYLASVYFVVDTVAPTVSVSPVGTNVSTDASIVAKFSSDIDRSSVRFVVDDVEYSATWSWFGHVATCDMSAPLTAAQEHHASVYGRDMAGNEVSKQWTFRTVDSGTVIGRVLDLNTLEVTRTAIANMIVQLDCGMTAVTDQDGRFTFENVPIGEHELSFANANYTIQRTFTNVIDVIVTKDKVTDVGDITIFANDQAPMLLDWIRTWFI